ncbi:regulatory protein [Streptomyces sp. NBRC 110611]|uniref:response regulator n=1 Tax=Streptomyces sp. NBRC 110611 TaxID=1621259 RepID=UPI000857AEF9|nr:response regulator [Streptomyces sp. NBRC 110611]GAU68125.1 regulatory protein [Streptomyces sp. NBRC 110611]
MSDAMWIKIIGTIPAVLWVAFAATVYFTLRGTIIQRLVPRLTALRALGVEVELAGELLDRAQDESRPGVTATARRMALGRLEHAAEVLQGGKVLWVDDHPEGNAALLELFRAAGMHIDIALSTEEATPCFRRTPYDMIISDLDREGDPQAGITMLRVLERYRIDVPVLIYAGRFDPERGVDRRIFAATTAPVELVHYVIDLMERSRLGSL